MALLISSTALAVGNRVIPLSPLPFVIFMEALSKMLSAIVDGGFLSGFYVGSRNFDVIHIVHLLFVYDTLLLRGKPKTTMLSRCLILML